MRRTGFTGSAIVAAVALLGAAHAHAHLEIEFIPQTPAHRQAAKTYATIWAEHGARIVAALEDRTCLPLAEAKVAAVVADAPSHSGGPEHAMRLRATYSRDTKLATLVHELGHRHLWQLEERLDNVDGHRTLFLVLDRVWSDVRGEAFAEASVSGESGWDAEYDYAAAWEWSRGLTAAERAALWSRLLVMNGLAGAAGSCDQVEKAVIARN